MPQRPLEARDAVAAVGLRDGTPADVDALVPLINDAYRKNERALFTSSRTDAEDLRAAIDPPRRTLIVAELGSELAGATVLTVRDGIAEFGPLAVDKRLQRAGTGAALVAEAERRAAGAGCWAMEITCVNEVGLQAWYERLGYAVTRTVEEPLDSERSRAWGASRPWAMLHLRKELR